MFLIFCLNFLVLIYGGEGGVLKIDLKTNAGAGTGGTYLQHRQVQGLLSGY